MILLDSYYDSGENETLVEIGVREFQTYGLIYTSFVSYALN